MNDVRQMLFVALAALAAGCAGVRTDLSAPREWHELGSVPVDVVTTNGLLPIVAADSPQDRQAAVALATAIGETSGRRPFAVFETPGRPSRFTKALFVGNVSANAGWTCALTNESVEAFRVVAADGCVRFLGRTDYAVSDWCERELGLRFYCSEGRCPQPKPEIRARAVDYSDRPVFEHRVLGGENDQPWVRFSKAGSAHRGGVNAHAPAGWYADEALKAEHPEIFETGETPMLCYGNPATLDYYKHRIDRHIAGLEDSGGIVNTNRKVVTVCQWDAPLKCACPFCRLTPDGGPDDRGSASPVIWGRFLKRLSAWLAVRHPDYMISFLPYLNTCEVPPALRPGRGSSRVGRHGYERRHRPLQPLANCEAEVCTMPGLALLKDGVCKRREERIIRDWRRATGRPVLNWHYACWPAEWTRAPYVYGRTVQAHYADCADDLCGSYICGGETPRQALSLYVWMRCLWNPDVDVGAIYDGFARRMFGPAERPMRELVALQEECWNRSWQKRACSYRNVFEISYPRADVLRMKELLREAYRRAGEARDERATRRIDWYASGLVPFLAESDANALRTGRKEIRPGVTNEMVRAQSVKWPTPWAKTAVVTSVEGKTLRLSVRCVEPAAARMDFTKLKDDYVWDNDCVSFFFGEGTARRTATVYLNGTVDRARGWTADEPFEARVTHDATGWSVEAYVPLREEELAAGYVLGNLARWRVGDRRRPASERVPGSLYEESRLDTRYTAPNDDPAAFSAFELR